MNNIELFEGQDVKVKTDEGTTLINLVHVAKCCGLTRKNNRGNGLKVRWDDIKKKINSLGVESSNQIKEEINYILDEIENTDDRNTIYISTWLAKRLAVECHSDRAMRFKNFLVTMDERREEKITFNPNNALEQFAVASEQMAIIGQAVQGLQKMTLGIQEYVKDSIQSKDKQIDEIKELVGMRSVNTHKLSKRLKEILSSKYGRAITASSNEYKFAKRKILREFDVLTWEQIPVIRFNEVFAFIEEVL